MTEFIKKELWDLVDAVVDYKYYGGPELDLEMILKKKSSLDEFLRCHPDIPEDSPEVYQARFIINNALRTGGFY